MTAESRLMPIFQLRCRRTFSTSTALAAKSTIKRVKHQHADVPPYPYGINRWYKKSNLGLYGGLMLLTGHNVSEKTETKTRRKWRPNVVRKKLYSASLERLVQVKVATRVLRTIDKVGGLDEYLLGGKPARIKELGMFGWLLRWRIMQTPAVKERFEQQRQQLGLNQLEAELADQNAALVGMQGEEVSPDELDRQIKQFDAELDKRQLAENDDELAEMEGEEVGPEDLQIDPPRTRSTLSSTPETALAPAQTPHQQQRI